MNRLEILLIKKSKAGKVYARVKVVPRRGLHLVPLGIRLMPQR